VTVPEIARIITVEQPVSLSLFDALIILPWIAATYFSVLSVSKTAVLITTRKKEKQVTES
jgi:hypothetical protein